MYLKYNHGGLHCGEVHEVDRDAPSSTDSEDEAMRNGFHEDSDNADNELSDNEDELPYNVEAFINPVFDIDDLNLEDEDDLHSDEEQPTEGHNYYAVNEANSQQSSSSSDMSDISEENQQEIVEPENEQQQLNNLERVNSTEQNASNNPNNEHTNNFQQGSTSNLEKSGTNDINPNSNNNPIYDTSDYIFVSWEDERIEPIAITTSTYRPCYSPNICYGPYNSVFEPRESPVNMNAFNYRGPPHFGYPSFYPLYNGARSNVGNMHTPRYNIPPIPPLFNTTFSSQHHAAGNPGNTTLHFMPILRHTFYNNSRLPTSHYPFSAAGRCYLRQYSTIFTNNHRDYTALYSTNYGAPDNSGYTGLRWTHNNYIGAGSTPRNDPTRYNPPRDNARYRMPQAFGNDAVNHFASGTAQSTNHNNLPSPGHSSSEAPAYFGPHFCGYGNPNSSWYIAPDYSSDVPRSSQFNINPYFEYTSLPYRDTQGVSENAAPQSPVSQVNEEDTGASASNSYGGAGTSSYNAPARNESTRNSASYKTPQASGIDTSNNFASGTTQSKNNNNPPLPGHSSSEAPAYFGPHFCGCGNLNSSWYIAPDYSSDVPRYPHFSLNPYFEYVSGLYRDNQGVSENTTSQSPVSEVNEGATGASASNSYGGADTPNFNAPARNEPTQNSASYKTPQVSGNDSSDNLASGVMQSTNPVTTADRIAKATTSRAPNTPGYGSSSSTDRNDQLLPRHVISVPPFYHRSHSHENDHPHSSSALSGTADSSQYSAPTSSSPDTLDVSVNVASQFLLPQVLSRDVASSSEASNNFRASGSIVRSNFEASGSVMSHNPDFPGARRYSSSGWLFLYLRYNDPDFNMPSGRHSDGDAELGPSGAQRRLPPLSSGSQSRSLPTSTGQHGHSYGDKHGQ